MARSRKRSRSINVHVHMPKGMYVAGGRAAAGIFFSNPVVAIVAVAAALILFVVIGGLSLSIIFGMLTNPWMWVAAFIFGMLTSARTGLTVVFSVLMGMIFFGIQIYQEYAALQPICSIPIFGQIICGGWSIVSFIPKMIVFGETITISFLMVWTIGYLKYELQK